MNKIHVVEFTSGTTAKTITGLFQWNFGQILQIKGLDLPSAVEVHFALRRSGEALRRIGVTKDGVTEVEIPDVLFKTMMTSDYDIYAYVYVSDEEYGSTTHEIIMKVKSRPMPEDIQNNFDELMKAVNALADGKVDKNQGTENNGKFLGVVDGYLVLVDAPSGGSDFPAQPLSSIMTFDSTAYYHINVDDIPDGYTYYYNDCCTDATSNLQLITFTKDGYDDVSNVMYSSDKLPFLISKVQTGALFVMLYSRDGYRQIKYSTDGTVTKGDYVQYISKSEVLSKYNTTEYTPTEDYHPATKKYVDDKKLSNFKNDLWGEEKELFLTLTQDDFEKTYHNIAMMYFYTCSRTETLDFLTDVDSIDITGVFDGVCINKTENATFSDETYRDSSFGEDNKMYSFEIYKTDSGFTLRFNSDNEFSDFTIEIYKAVLTKIPAKYLDLSGISIDTTAIEEEIDALTEEVNAL